MRKLKLTVGGIELACELFETATADAIWTALPFSSSAMTWGDEVYFTIPVAMPREDGARALVEAGELAYWPDGKALAIGFGQTPISAPGEIRLASDCNIWGRALSDVTVLARVCAGDPIEVSRAD